MSETPPPSHPAWGGAPGGYGAPPAAPTSGRATTVMVLGIVSLATFFMLCGLGFVPAVIALAMAPGARREIAESGGRLQGEGQVRAGVIMSWITLGLTAVGLVVLVVAIALLVATAHGTDGTGAALAGALVSAF